MVYTSLSLTRPNLSLFDANLSLPLSVAQGAAPTSHGDVLGVGPR